MYAMLGFHGRFCYIAFDFFKSFCNSVLDIVLEFSALEVDRETMLESNIYNVGGMEEHRIKRIAQEFKSSQKSFNRNRDKNSADTAATEFVNISNYYYC